MTAVPLKKQFNFWAYDVLICKLIVHAVLTYLDIRENKESKYFGRRFFEPGKVKHHQGDSGTFLQISKGSFGLM